MKVELICCTPSPEKIIASAAKICYSKSDINGIMESLDEANTASYVKMISELGHSSVIEHSYFTFGIEGVSRSLLAEITRHRIASFSVQSQRYVRENMFEYVMPPEIAESDEAASEFKEAMEEDQRHYDKISSLLKEKHKKSFMADGMNEKAAVAAAEKRAIEDARFVLPNACTTKIIMTMNCRSLMNFFELRCCNRAQWEIRGLAWEMLRLVYKEAPHVFANAGPSCLSGKCSEGKMSCGHSGEIRKKYDDMIENING